MKKTVKHAGRLEGNIVLPGDKSVSHRAAIMCAIARGRSRLRNFSRAEDCAATVGCLKELGVHIERLADDDLVVQGAGQCLHEPENVLDARNSGSTMRMMAGLLASQPFFSVMTGDESLRSRPMERIVKPLTLMGASIWARDSGWRAPLAIRGGSLHGIRYELPVASAQVKTAILIAGLFAEGRTVVKELVPSRDHTERLLGVMGASIQVQGGMIMLEPGILSPLDLRMPGDISSGAGWLVVGAIHPRAQVRILGAGLNPGRTGVIDILKKMGADIAVESEDILDGEPVGDIVVRSSTLSGVEIGGEIVPRLVDEIPLLALAGSVGEGATTIRDAGELRVKESDRISMTVQELRKLGASVEELPDGMTIHGRRRLRGALCDSHGDHRLGIMLGVAGLVAEGQTTVNHAEAVNVSYPAFWDDLDDLASGRAANGS